MERTKFTDETTTLQKLKSFNKLYNSHSPNHQKYKAVVWRQNFRQWNSELRNRSIASHFASKTTFIASLNWENPWTETCHNSLCRSLFPKRNLTFKNIWCLKRKNTRIFLKSSKLQNESSVRSAQRIVHPINNHWNTLSPLPQLLVYLVLVTKDPAVIAAILLATLKATTPKKRRKVTTLRIPNDETECVVYGTNTNDLLASYNNNNNNLFNHVIV